MTDFENPAQLAEEAATDIRRRSGIDSIDVALVLGSGWAAAVDKLGHLVRTLPLGSIPGFSKPVVSGHGGDALIIHTESGRTALVLTGRTHLFEGLGVDPVVHGVRTAAALGASDLILTNGCGGLNPNWGPGTVVVIRDHINLTGVTPVRGATFIDQTYAYSARLRGIVHDTVPGLDEGVYVQFRGPQYESPAEVRMAGIIGGDLVGMSTVLENIAAREAGLQVLGLSLVTNQAAGISASPLDHSEVLAAGRAAGPRLAGLLADIVNSI